MLKTIALGIFAVFSLIFAMAAGAHTAEAGTRPVEVTAASGPTKGLVTVRWAPEESHLQVNYKGRPQQVLSIDVFMPPDDTPRLELVDLSGDGYEDLVVTDSINGISQEFQSAYLWIPMENKFVKSKTISDIGEVEPDNSPGCVRVSGVCKGRTQFYEDKFCFNQAKGRWKRISSFNGCR
jgi:hypothetical protein